MKRSLVIAAAALLSGSAACGGARPSAPVVHEEVEPRAAAHADAAVPALVCTESTAAVAADRIARIEIRGARVPKDFCSALAIEPGGPFDEDRIDAALRALWADGRVEDVSALREAEGARSSLVFLVRMRPSVVSFEIRGSAAGAPSVGLDAERLAFANPALLHDATTRAEREMKEAGWLGAKVDYEITPRGEGSVAIVIDIQPGSRAVVRSVRIEGPSAARQVELASLMRIRVDEPYEKLALERDTLVIQADGYDRGLITTKVDEPAIAVREGGAGVDIVLRVTEGPAYRIGKVAFEGDLVGPRKTYERDLWSSAPAAIFSRKVIAADLEKIRAFHESRGSSVDVSPETSIDAARGIVDITVRITQRR